MSCLLAPLHDGLAAESRIAPDVDTHLGPAPAQLLHDALELLDAARRTIAVRPAQSRTQQMFAAENVQRQITVAAVVPVEKSSLLATVQRVVGRIEVQPDLAWGASMRFHKQLDQ